MPGLTPQEPPMPEETPAAEAQEAPAQGGGLKELVVGINSNMLKFKETIQGVPEIPQDLKGQLDNIIQQYQQFVQSLAQSTGGKAPAEAPVEQAQPAAPAAPKPPMRGKMPMSGGPGAKPVLQ